MGFRKKRGKEVFSTMLYAGCCILDAGCWMLDRRFTMGMGWRVGVISGGWIAGFNCHNYVNCYKLKTGWTDMI